MRLFIAAELSEELHEALGETSALLRAGVRGRYVAPDSFHVTLAFLGEVASARIGAVEEALDEACHGVEPFGVALGELGSFGRRSKAVLWQGFSEAGELAEVARAVRVALAERSLSFDEKPFRAHVTLMRAADLSSGILPAPVLAAGEIDSITLFRSDLSGSRPIYERVHTATLRELG